jgi:hypothetical protein
MSSFPTTTTTTNNNNSNVYLISSDNVEFAVPTEEALQSTFIRMALESYMMEADKRVIHFDQINSKILKEVIRFLKWKFIVITSTTTSSSSKATSKNLTNSTTNSEQQQQQTTFKPDPSIAMELARAAHFLDI